MLAIGNTPLIKLEKLTGHDMADVYPKIVIKEYIMTIRLRKSIQFKEL